MSPTERPAGDPHPGMGFAQFVALIAAMMAINALSIDAMLPALPEIGRDLGVHRDNERQWVVTSYLLGFGVAQLVYGPVADRFGRKPVLLTGLALYTVFTIASVFATSMPMMILARVLQGGGAAATRVLAISIVRDCYSGRRMARVMSLTFIVFLLAPMIAPTAGQGILLVAPWRAIFGALALFGGAVTVWTLLKLPETLHPEDRRPIRLATIVDAVRQTFTRRMSVGYMLASTLIVGALFAFINSAEQVFSDALGRPELFAALFALVAGFIAIAAFVNSRIVERGGTRRVSHTALLGFIAFAAIHAAVAASGHESLLTFVVLQGGMMFCFGLVGSNFGAMAMEPLGHIAGTASSVQGFVSTTGGALIGFFIGQQFDGTVVPLTLGWVGCGLAALAIVLLTEKGRLFHPIQGR